MPQAKQYRDGGLIIPNCNKINELLTNTEKSAQISADSLEDLYKHFGYADQVGETLLGKELSNNIVAKLLREIWSGIRSKNDRIIALKER